MSASDAILFLGLNETASHEARTLRERGNQVTFIGKIGPLQPITYQGVTYALGTRSGVEGLVRALGLPGARAAALVSAIDGAGADIKDELGELAIQLARMEKDRKGPSRWIISGHSVGSMFWGERNGMVTVDTLGAVLAVFPSAAALIEDLHLSACYSGKEGDLIKWRSLLPSLMTVWAYAESAPGSYSGATTHLSTWDRHTRGSKDGLRRAVADRSRKGQSVAVWSRRFGYESARASGIQELLDRITAAEPTFQEFFQGIRNVADTQSGPLRDYYNDVQMLVGHPLATPAQIARYRTRVDVTIRLIFFDKAIKTNFNRRYAADLEKGYRALRQTKPDFPSLTRKGCLERVAAFERDAAALHASRPGPSDAVKRDVGVAKVLLLDGLRGLDPSLIPVNWI